MFSSRMIAACLVLLGCAPASADTRPSRSECIIGYRMDWSDVELDRRDVVKSFAAANRTEVREALSAMAVKSDQSELYLQFSKDCEEKEKMALRQIDFWRTKGLQLPRFERIPDPITPSTDTIDVRGPYWRDGQPESVPLDRTPMPQNTSFP